MQSGSLGTSNLFRWTREHLQNVLVGGLNPILKDPELIEAFSKIDRKDFVPEKLSDRAYEDADLEIGYSENFTRPTIIGQMAQLLKPHKGGTYLDIGTGTGFFAVLLGMVAGQTGQVFTIERVQWLWEMAHSNAENYPEVKNIKFLYRDGREGLINQAPFDGIHIAFAMKEVPENLRQQLSKNDGRLVVPTPNYDLRLIERNGDDFTEEIIPGFVFQEGREGLA